ncbi:MAG: DUF2490 domain-containing protein [Bacteroidetes bacterium]|nr:DUF2490 domain-containing protein [Bacteroidota bacterium]
MIFQYIIKPKNKIPFNFRKLNFIYLFSFHLFTLLSFHICFGQKIIVKNENQQWVQYYSQIKLSNKNSLLIDGGVRWKEHFSKRSQYILRAGYSHSIAPNAKMTLGFALSGVYNTFGLSSLEYRPYQDLEYKFKLKSFDFNNRLRFEERFIQPVSSFKNTFNIRFRYQLVISYPLINLSKTNPDCIFLFKMGNEIFMNSVKQHGRTFFDQNRYTVSPTVQFSKKFQISLTWNIQLSSTPTKNMFKYSNIYWLQIRHVFE